MPDPAAPDPAARRAERSRRAREAALAAARRFGLPADDPVVLGDQFSVVLHLRPAPVIVRVPTWTTDVRDPHVTIPRDLAVGAWLHGRGVPVAPPSPEVPPGPHVEDDHAMSFWTHVPPDPAADEVSASALAAMLRDLHGELADYPGELAGLEPAGGDIAAGVSALDHHRGLLDADQDATLRAAADELLGLTVDPGAPVQPLHGDVHPHNVVVGRDGPVWIDFEEACRGPIAWDLGMYPWTDDGAAALAAYGEVDPAVLRSMARLRALHLACFLLRLREDFGDTPQWDASIVWFVGLLSRLGTG